MPKKPYPSQTAPTPKRPKRIGDGSKIPKPAQMPKQMGPDKGKVIKPYKGPRATSGGPSSSGKKRTPSARRQPPSQTGIMGSTNQQRQDVRNAAIEMMRKNNMMRKKQG